MKKLSFFLMAMLVSMTSFAAALGEGYSKVTDITTLSAGDKVVLYCDDAELGVTGWNGNKDATVAAEGWVEYVVEAADGGVLLKDGEQYIALTAKNGFYYTATGSVCKVNAEGVLYITFSGADYLLYEQTNGDNKYYRMYVDKSSNTSYKPFYVYKKAAVVEPTEVTVYCINSAKWDVVACHHWVEEGSTTSWPGDVMTKTEETVNGFDVYAATFTIEHTSCIFNNNNKGSQTANLTVENGHYYYVKDAKWYASLADVPALDPLATDVYLAGDMNEWSTVANEFRKATEDATTASLTLTLEAATTYEFKVVKESAWFGNNGTITTSVEGWTFTTGTNNCKLTTDAAGEYVLTWDLNTDKLSVTYPELVTTITKTFDLTQAGDTRNMGGAYVIYAGDYTLRIYGYNGAGTYQDDPTTEEDAAPMLFTPDYDDALDAVVVVTIDEENNKEVMQVTATSADGKKIYNLTINIALPSYETFNFVATGVTAVPETEDGFTTYALEGEFDNEGTPLPFELYATTEPASVMGTIGEEFVMGEGENVAFFIEADNSFFLMAKLQDEQGNIYNIEMMGTVAASQDVEIVVAKEENITLYNLNLDVQGGMAMVSAGNDALSFGLTLLPSENYYGGYMNDAFSNIWYGDDQLYAAYGDMHLYGDNNGQVMFVVSFITTPDAEGNVTKYNFTLYPGDQPVDSKHTVTITVYPEGAGTVTGAGEYEDGAEVTVTAEENEGWYFMGWMDATTEILLAEDYEYTFQALGDVNLIAYFIPALKGQSTDLVIGENTLTASTELSLGTLNMNLVLGEGAEGVYEITEESTLTIGDKAVTLMAGIAMVIPEDQMAAAIMIVEYNEELYYIEVLMVAPASSVDNINTNAAPRKVIRDGQLIIIKNGVEYNVQGAILK